MSGQNAEGKTGQAVLSTSDDLQKVRDFYSNALEKAGLEVNTTEHSGPQGQGAIINANSADNIRQAVIILGTGESGTTASVSFTDAR
jgi:hypothetical protein